MTILVPYEGSTGDGPDPREMKMRHAAAPFLRDSTSEGQNTVGICVAAARNRATIIA